MPDRASSKARSKLVFPGSMDRSVFHQIARVTLSPPVSKRHEHLVRGGCHRQSGCHQRAVVHMQRDGVEGDARQMSANGSCSDHGAITPEHYFPGAHQASRMKFDHLAPRRIP